MKLKKGDEIIVIAGKDKGKKGKIETVLPKEHAVVVPNVNMYKRHKKRRDEKTPGGIISLPRALDASKVMLVCPSCEKMTRVGYMMLKDEKVRICRKCKKKI